MLPSPKSKPSLISEDKQSEGAELLLPHCPRRIRRWGCVGWRSWLWAGWSWGPTPGPEQCRCSWGQSPPPSTRSCRFLASSWQCRYTVVDRQASELLVWFGSVWFRLLWYRSALVWSGRSLVLGVLVKAQDLEKEERGRDFSTTIIRKTSSVYVTCFSLTSLPTNWQWHTTYSERQTLPQQVDLKVHNLNNQSQLNMVVWNPCNPYKRLSIFHYLKMAPGSHSLFRQPVPFMNNCTWPTSHHLVKPAVSYEDSRSGCC